MSCPKDSTPSQDFSHAARKILFQQAGVIVMHTLKASLYNRNMEQLHYFVQVINLNLQEPFPPLYSVLSPQTNVHSSPLLQIAIYSPGEEHHALLPRRWEWLNPWELRGDVGNKSSQQGSG